MFVWKTINSVHQLFPSCLNPLPLPDLHRPKISKSAVIYNSTSALSAGIFQAAKVLDLICFAFLLTAHGCSPLPTRGHVVRRETRNPWKFVLRLPVCDCIRAFVHSRRKHVRGGQGELPWGPQGCRLGKKTGKWKVIRKMPGNKSLQMKKDIPNPAFLQNRHEADIWARQMTVLVGLRKKSHSCSTTSPSPKSTGIMRQVLNKGWFDEGPDSNNMYYARTVTPPATNGNRLISKAKWWIHQARLSIRPLVHRGQYCPL